MARTGVWALPTVVYGAPPSVIKPSDNVVEATPSQLEADELDRQIRELLADIANSLRDPNAGNARLP